MRSYLIPCLLLIFINTSKYSLKEKKIIIVIVFKSLSKSAQFSNCLLNYLLKISCPVWLFHTVLLLDTYTHYFLRATFFRLIKFLKKLSTKTSLFWNLISSSKKTVQFFSIKLKKWRSEILNFELFFVSTCSSKTYTSYSRQLKYKSYLWCTEIFTNQFVNKDFKKVVA